MRRYSLESRKEFLNMEMPELGSIKNCGCFFSGRAYFSRGRKVVLFMYVQYVRIEEQIQKENGGCYGCIIDRRRQCADGCNDQ